MRNGAHSPNAICCAGCANGAGHDPECDVRNGVNPTPDDAGQPADGPALPAVFRPRGHTHENIDAVFTAVRAMAFSDAPAP